MFRQRRILSGAPLAGAAVIALALVASAPAATGSRSATLGFLTGTHARGEPVPLREWLDAGAFPREDGSPPAANEPATAETRVVIEASDAALARRAVARVGGRVERSAGGLVQAVVRRGALPALESTAGVERVRAPYTRIPHAVSGEGVSATLAAAWHAKGFTGKGVKVAVIDGGFAGLAERQASGDLPASVVTQDFCGGELTSGEEHGTAVAEIVHEMAPAAQLYLVCIDTDVDFVAAVAYARSQGVHVVNHSAGWEGPFRNDGTDRFSAVVADAKASGILWVNSAGNEGDTHWTGTYSPNRNLHAWDASGDIGNTFVWPDGSTICGFLKWDEWPAGVSDFDLGLFLSGANVLLASSEEVQGEGGGEPPFEAVCDEQASGEDLTVFWAIRGYSVRSSPRLDLVSWSPRLEYSVAAGSVAAPASSPAALAVGALCWQSRQLEPYSSQGPTIDGRVKPDLVGHDSFSSATYGSFEGFCPSGFAGTSASSPEVAGAAALVKQAYPAYGPDQLRSTLMTAARDLGAPGLDSIYGAGELQLPKPPDVAAPTAKALVSTGRRGKVLGLRSTVSDDSGELRVVEQVYAGRTLVATISRPGYVKASRALTVTTRWKTPARAAGSYRHCVRVTDRAGNVSPVSCAKLVLR